MPVWILEVQDQATAHEERTGVPVTAGLHLRSELSVQFS